MSDRFKIVRADGRSNAQVLLDHVKGAEPGTTYTYDELSTVLGAGTSRIYEVADVRSVVMSAYPRLLKEQQRALHNIRGIGYRLALAKEHTGLALWRKRRADLQFKRGLQTLRHVRWEEMDVASRETHQGHLMLTESLFAIVGLHDRKIRRIEESIAGLHKRMDDLGATS